MTMAHSAGHAGIRHAKPKRKRRALRLLVWPLLIVTLAVSGASYVGYVLWPRWPGIPVTLDAPAIPVTVAGVTFNVAPAAIRVAVQRKPGTQERLDLAYLWPSLTPPDPAVEPPRVSAETPLEDIKAQQRIFLSIVGAEATLPPEARRRTIYPRYLTNERQQGPAGLTEMPFRSATPYQGEDLVFDAAAPDAFALRCTRAGAGRVPGTCIYERRVGTADLTIRFPRDWLTDWRGVAANIERLIALLNAKV